MLVRQAHEIEWVRKAHNSKSPVNYYEELKPTFFKENIKFIGFIGEWKGNTTKLKLQCCNGHTFTITINNFNAGNRCHKCADIKNGRMKSFSEDEHLHKLTPIFDKENILFNGFIGEWKRSSTKLNLQCCNGHTFTPTINNFKNGRRCQECYRLKLKELKSIPKDDYIIRIKPIFDKENILFNGFIGEWKGNTTKLKLQCCNGHTFTPTVNGFLSGNRCSSCARFGYNTLKHGTLYIQKLIKKSCFYGIKFGITNLTTQERMRNQSRVSKFDHEIFYELTLQDGQKILELENKIKEAMKGKTSYISKEDMPDGYTETVAPSELSTIMYIVKTFEKELTA